MKKFIFLAIVLSVASFSLFASDYQCKENDTPCLNENKTEICYDGEWEETANFISKRGSDDVFAFEDIDGYTWIKVQLCSFPSTLRD